MIEVPVPLVSVTSYEIKNSKKDWFGEYVETHNYEQKENGTGFIDQVYLEKSRIASLFLCPLEVLRYDVQFNEGIKYLPKKKQYLDTVIFIYNDSEMLEIIGMNSRNYKTIRRVLNDMEKGSDMEFRRHLILSPEIFQYLIEIHKEDKVMVSRLAYYLSEKGQSIKRYEYGQDLTHRLSELKDQYMDLFAIGGNINLGDLRISFYARKNGRTILYNMVKTPLTWNNVFDFLDNIIYHSKKRLEVQK